MLRRTRVLTHLIARAAALLAVATLVLHGALPGLSHAAHAIRYAGLAAHLADCPGHEAGSDAAAAALRQAHAGAAHTDPAPAGHVPLDRQPDCCCSPLPPAMLPLTSPAWPVAVPRDPGVAPALARAVEGLSPEGPSKPPRTSDEA